MKKGYKGFGGFMKNILIMFTASYTLISLIWQINMHAKLKNADFVNVFTQNVNTNSAQKILNLFVNNTMPTILYYSIVISITFGALVYIIKDAKEINDKYAKVESSEEKNEELTKTEIVVEKKPTTKASATKTGTTKKTATKASSSKASTTKKAATKASSSKTGATKKTATKASTSKTGTTKKTTTKASTSKKATTSKK